MISGMIGQKTSVPIAKLTRKSGQWLLVASSALFLAVAGCSSDEPVTQVLNDQPVEDLYNDGLDQLSGGNFIGAALTFDEVERQHPFSIWAPRAQLMSGYAHFQADNYDDAVNALDRFIQLHPGHEDVAYASYLRALTFYEQIVDVARDQAATEAALKALDEVAKRYPNTDYARDAKLKRDLAFDHLAGREMVVGRYYQRQGKPVAALNRFTNVLVRYQTTSHAPEALHRLVETYRALGMKEEAERFAAVLGHNFPSSEWYSDSYALLTGERVDVSDGVDDRGLYSRSIDLLFSPNYRIGVVDQGAEVQGTGVEAQTLGAGIDDGVTRAELLGDDVKLPQGATIPSTVPEITGVTQQAVKAGEANASDAAATEAARKASGRLQIDALMASAAQQKASADKASAGWQQYATAPGVDDAALSRAKAQVLTANAASRYWGARESLLGLALRELDGEAVDADARTKAETAVAESGVEYWQTVAQHGQSETERKLAAANAADAKKALAFWQNSGRSWVGRLLGSST
jgi:outer membrane protein assembly factor BamD